MTPYDVVTLGETMLKFTPPSFKRLEQTPICELEAGGSESNLAIALTRLGLKVMWLSRLTDNPLGRFIEQAIAAQGVDTSRVIWTDADRVGLYFVEESKPPRHSKVIYDCKNSAISQMRASELPVDLFMPGKARLLHLSGITPALSPTLAVAAQRAMNLAQEAGWQFSFDLNYRAKLWTPAAALTGCSPFMAAANILLAPLGDMRLLFELPPSTPPEQVLSLLRERYPQATIALTMGKDGALGCEPSGTPLFQPAFPAEEVGRLGSGDAFAAGFLYQYLTLPAGPDKLAQALLWGEATAAFKYTIPGDIPWLSRAEVAELIQRGATDAKLVR